MTERIANLAGVGAHLPKTIMTNDDISRIVDTSDAWIRERTGIRERRIAGEGETTVTLGAEAARKALAHAGMSSDEVDLIIVATTTPDLVFPSSASMIQAELGITQGAAFDVQAVCSGFIYALSIADGMLARGQSEVALVIGSETMSRLLDWTDRSTCVLFGDGAGAWVLKARDRDPLDEKPAGVLGAYLRTDGRFRHLLYTDGGPSTTQTSGLLRMAGNQVFRHAIVNISESMTTLMQRQGVSVDEIDWFVPHQANQRILEGVAKKLGIPSHKVISTVALHGNTSAASVPLAFEHAVTDGRIKRGDLCLMEALGGGFTWGAALVRY